MSIDLKIARFLTAEVKELNAELEKLQTALAHDTAINERRQARIIEIEAELSAAAQRIKDVTSGDPRAR